MTDLLKMIEQWEADAKYMLAKPCSPEDHILEQYGDYRDERILKLSKALKIADSVLRRIRNVSQAKDDYITALIASEATQEIESIMKETK